MKKMSRIHWSTWIAVGYLVALPLYNWREGSWYSAYQTLLAYLTGFILFLCFLGVIELIQKGAKPWE